MHIVDSGTDTGPIVIQGAVPVIQGDDADTLAARILLVEHQIYPTALRWAAEGRLDVRDGSLRVCSLRPDETRWLWGGDRPLRPE